jgi:hypothetical protein
MFLDALLNPELKLGATLLYPELIRLGRQASGLLYYTPELIRPGGQASGLLYYTPS